MKKHKPENCALKRMKIKEIDGRSWRFCQTAVLSTPCIMESAIWNKQPNLWGISSQKAICGHLCLRRMIGFMKKPCLNTMGLIIHLHTLAGAATLVL